MATDQQAAMEQLRALYREKNEHLEKFLEPCAASGPLVPAEPQADSRSIVQASSSAKKAVRFFIVVSPLQIFL